MESYSSFHTFRAAQNTHHIADDIFKSYIVDWMYMMLCKMSLNFVPMGFTEDIRTGNGLAPTIYLASHVYMTIWRR